MIEHFTIEKILALNPQIDKKDPEEIQKILRGMRGSKKSRHRRNLIPPYARHRVTIGGDGWKQKTKKEAHFFITSFLFF